MGDHTLFLVAGHILLEIFLLINYFFDATQTSNRMCLKGPGNPQYSLVPNLRGVVENPKTYLGGVNKRGGWKIALNLIDGGIEKASKQCNFLCRKNME